MSFSVISEPMEEKHVELVDRMFYDNILFWKNKTRKVDVLFHHQELAECDAYESHTSVNGMLIPVFKYFCLKEIK